MPDQLRTYVQPRLTDGRMILAFSGWMDGGHVSTGTVEWLVNTLDAQKAAKITPDDFYLYSFPGSMDVSTLVRPHTRIEDGLITAYDPPANVFFCHTESELVLFSGKEPHFNWAAFADCLFSFASQVGVSSLYFIGSVASTVPHTREPRLMSAVSHESLKKDLEPYGVKFTNYEGPASFSTYLMTEAGHRGFRMASLVAEIPAYIDGGNPKSIEAVIRKLGVLLNVRVNLDALRAVTDAWEKRLHDALEDHQDLAGYIRKLEADYDNEVFDTQMGDLKEWLQQRGIRVD